MKILISGYYGFDNAGDELILESIISSLREQGHEHAITVHSASPSKTASIYKVHAVNRWNYLHIILSILSCDVLVSGGGGLFQDRTGNATLYYYLAVLFLAKIFGKKVFIYAVGINELKKHNSFFAARVLGLADKITVREPFSRELLKKWKCKASDIEITADPVLKANVKYRPLKTEHPKVAIVLRPPHKGQLSVSTFAKIADSLSHLISAKIIFIPFHMQKDLPFTLSVMNSMQSAARLVKWNNAHELYGIFSDVDMVISQRLHALILAALYEIPLVGISDDPKIARFLNELGQKNISLRGEANPYSLLAVIADAWEWRDEFRKNVSSILPSFRLRSKMTSGLLNQMLSRAQ